MLSHLSKKKKKLIFLSLPNRANVQPQGVQVAPFLIAVSPLGVGVQPQGVNVAPNGIVVGPVGKAYTPQVREKENLKFFRFGL